MLFACISIPDAIIMVVVTRLSGDLDNDKLLNIATEFVSRNENALTILSSNGRNVFRFIATLFKVLGK